VELLSTIPGVSEVVNLEDGPDVRYGLVTKCRPLYRNARGGGKAIPLKTWSDPEGSRKLRFPRFRDNGTG